MDHHLQKYDKQSNNNAIILRISTKKRKRNPWLVDKCYHLKNLYEKEKRNTLIGGQMNQKRITTVKAQQPIHQRRRDIRSHRNSGINLASTRDWDRGAVHNHMRLNIENATSVNPWERRIIVMMLWRWKWRPGRRIERCPQSHHQCEDPRGRGSRRRWRRVAPAVI